MKIIFYNIFNSTNTLCTLVCLIDEQGLISAQGGKKIKKLINAQGLIIIILYCLIRAHRVDFFFKKIKRPWSCIRQAGVSRKVENNSTKCPKVIFYAEYVKKRN